MSKGEENRDWEYASYTEDGRLIYTSYEKKWRSKQIHR